jgi:hypothetical protein
MAEAGLRLPAIEDVDDGSRPYFLLLIVDRSQVLILPSESRGNRRQSGRKL